MGQGTRSRFQKEWKELADPRSEDIVRQESVDNKGDMQGACVMCPQEPSVDSWGKGWIRLHYIKENLKKQQERIRAKKLLAKAVDVLVRGARRAG